MNKIDSKIINISMLLGITSVLLRDNALSSVFFGVFAVLILFEYLFKRIKFTFNRELWIVTLPFIIYFIGFLWSENSNNALNYIIRIIPIFIVPFLILSNNKKEYFQKGFCKIQLFFPRILISLFIFYFLFSVWLYYLGLGNYFFYSDFTSIVKTHSTTLSLIVIVSLIFVLMKKNKFSKIEFVFLIFFHIVFLLMISSKISFFVLGILFIYEIFNLNIKYKILSIIALFSLFFLLLFSILQYRFSTKKLNDGEQNSVIEMINVLYSKEIKNRILLWKSNYNAVNKKNMLLGFGTNPNDAYRLTQYNKYKMLEAVEKNYNAHNQYIEVYYSLGLFGLILFIIHLYYMLNISMKLGKYYVLLYLTFLIYFMTESLFIHSKAIILYSFIITLIYGTYKLKQNE